MAVRTLELQFVAAYGHSVIEEIRQAAVGSHQGSLLDTTDLSARQIATRMGYSGGVSPGRVLSRPDQATPTQYLAATAEEAVGQVPRT